MALQVMTKPQAITSLPTSAIPPHHRQVFAAVLRQLPCAVEARRQARLHRQPTPRSVFILDWDDTCCATSFLENCGFMADLDTRLDETAPDLARHLRVLESRVLSLLKTAVSLGTVLIVTNAGDGWVELSSSRFLPAVHSFLEYNYKEIKIISARARYVESFRQNPLQWKALTFSDELLAIYQKFPVPTCLNVFVLGDSVGDQYAAYAAANSITNARLPIVLKVVKFLERPSIDQLCKQLAIFLDNIVEMTLHNASFDVSLYKESPHVHQEQMHQLFTALQYHQMQLQRQHQQQQLAMQTATRIPSQGVQTPPDVRSTSSSASTVPSSSTESQHSLAHVSPMPPCAAAV